MVPWKRASILHPNCWYRACWVSFCRFLNNVHPYYFGEASNFQTGWFNLHLDWFIHWNNHVFFLLCFDSWNRNSSTPFLIFRVKTCFGSASQQHSPLFVFLGFTKLDFGKHPRIPHHQWRPPSCRLSLQAEVPGNWESHRAGEDERKNPGAQWQVTFFFFCVV